MAYTAKEKLEKLLEFIKKEEDLRTDFSVKCMDKNNMMGMQIHNAEAGMCTKVRWTLEDILSRNGSNPEWESMEFNEVMKYLHNSKKAKLKKWKDGAFIYWSNDKHTVIYHDNIGKEHDFKNAVAVYFYDAITSCDWMIVE